MDWDKSETTYSEILCQSTKGHNAFKKVDQQTYSGFIYMHTYYCSEKLYCIRYIIYESEIWLHLRLTNKWCCKQLFKWPMRIIIFFLLKILYLFSYEKFRFRLTWLQRHLWSCPFLLISVLADTSWIISNMRYISEGSWQHCISKKFF